MQFKVENTYRCEVMDGSKPVKPLIVAAPSFGKAAALAYAVISNWENCDRCEITSIHYVGQTII